MRSRMVTRCCLAIVVADRPCPIAPPRVRCRACSRSSGSSTRRRGRGRHADRRARRDPERPVGRGGRGDGASSLVTLSVLGSQILTGALNDWADRDVTRRCSRPSRSPPVTSARAAALTLAAFGLLLQVAASVPLGLLPPALGLLASASAVAYDLWLSRTPLSVLPYLVSFGAPAALDRRRRRRAAGAGRGRAAPGRAVRRGGPPRQHAARLRRRRTHRLAQPGPGARASRGLRAGLGASPWRRHRGRRRVRHRQAAATPAGLLLGAIGIAAVAQGSSARNGSGRDARRRGLLDRAWALATGVSCWTDRLGALATRLNGRSGRVRSRRRAPCPRHRSLR